MLVLPLQQSDACRTVGDDPGDAGDGGDRDRSNLPPNNKPFGPVRPKSKKTKSKRRRTTLATFVGARFWQLQ
jgi:hypothetical protein